ncbi:MAG: hypothetical protein A2521_09060 [Deltaproteobacteria bacterium RIFOXYD12_FULL_57_12]|nr:MAG: hypothetical protein A2521_09060 [Deltaproteobacteria bacterium RIFOXYD12_FULL_57_12]
MTGLSDRYPLADEATARGPAGRFQTKVSWDKRIQLIDVQTTPGCQAARDLTHFYLAGPGLDAWAGIYYHNTDALRRQYRDRTIRRQSMT